MNVFSFSRVYLVPLTVYLGWRLGGIYTFTTAFLVFVIGPFLDSAIGKYKRNPSQEAEKELEAANYAFLLRAVFGGFNSVWEFEAGRMKKQNKAVWSRHNPMAVALLIQTALWSWAR